MMNRPLFAFVISILLFGVSRIASSAVITYDESWFFSMYDGPTEIIDFSTLKDGTTYDQVQIPHPLLTNQEHFDGWGRYQALEYAWDDSHLIRTTNGGGGFWLAMRWDGNSVGNKHHKTTNVPLSIVSLLDVAPIAMYVTSSSYSGFVGLIPESINEDHMLFGLPELRVQEMQFGFKERSGDVPTPGTLVLLLGGILTLRRFVI